MQRCNRCVMMIERQNTMSDLNIPDRCKECWSDNLEWFSGVRNNGGFQDGRIRMHETDVIFFLGCNCCSETLLVLTGDEVAKWLNSMRKDKTQ